MTRRFFILTLALVAGLSSAACGEGPVEPYAVFQVSVVSGNALRLENRGGEPVYYALWEPSTDARTFWGACNRPDQGCPSVAANGEVRVPFSVIAGYEPGVDQANVYWWHIRAVDGGWTVDEVHKVTARLHR